MVIKVKEIIDKAVGGTRCVTEHGVKPIGLAYNMLWGRANC